MDIVFFPNSKIWDGNPFYTNLKAAVQSHDHNIIDGVGDHLDLKWIASNRYKRYVLHFHWIHYHYQLTGNPNFRKASVFLLKVLLSRFLGFKIVWTLHNLYPHDTPTSNLILEKFIRKVFARLCNRIIVMCDSARNILSDEFGVTKNIVVIPHGNYTFNHALEDDREALRNKYQISNNSIVYICHGNIRKYKNTSKIIEAFKKISSENNQLHLIIAGKPESGLMLEQIEGLCCDSNITLLPRFIDDDTLFELFTIADIAVFAFKKILNSGSVIEAMSAGLAIIAPASGCLPEILNESMGIVYSDYDDLDRSMLNILERDIKKLGLAAKQRANTLDWKSIGMQTSNTYMSL
ncbi:MAG: glycosyltransferase family 4 protein [Sedimenticola sp.]|nr:glycosyltransferase family 4 protein [Sedimenticola sp.]MCW8948248.1 glycosyltransferase family 4 protein [Sedimenticola sp.]